LALLMTNEVFARTWGDRAGAVPAEDYWPTVIGRVKAEIPEMVFIAEAYWDMEWTLQQQGFDLCYDKRLYDRLLHDPPDSIRAHLQADSSYQEGLIRFIENHDEPRAAASFGPAQERAAAIVMSTLQGARMYYDGQFEGRRVRLPVFLDREPEEPVDEDLRRFYRQLLSAVSDAKLADGKWQLCCLEGWSDNDSWRRLVTWCWSGSDSRHLVVVNLSHEAAQARVRLPWSDLQGHAWTLEDRLSTRSLERDGGELASEGLYVALEPWGWHFFGLSSHPDWVIPAPLQPETVTV
jgi:hypothetical protein